MVLFSPWKMTNPIVLQKESTFWLQALVLKSKWDGIKPSRSLPKNAPTNDLGKALERQDDSWIDDTVVSAAEQSAVKTD